MPRNLKLLAATAAGAIAFASSPALAAAGSSAGTVIVNTVTVNYKVGGVSQTAQTASNSVTVDRSINLTIASDATTSVSPAQSAAAIKYVLTNTSNDTVDFLLTAAQQSGGTAAHGGTDIFDTTNVKIYADTNSDGTFNAGDLQITYLDEVLPDTNRTVFVVSDIPIEQTNGQVAGIILTAQAATGGASNSAGTAFTQNTGANTSGIDTVFADVAGNGGDASRDGRYAAKGDYTVAAPVLTITKISTLVNDPINGTSSPKAIPGATLEYCIVVTNATGAATAGTLTVTDVLPSTVSYVPSYGIFLNGTASGTAPNYTCNTDGSAGGTFTAGSATVTGTLADLAAGATETLRFRATIN